MPILKKIVFCTLIFITVFINLSFYNPTQNKTLKKEKFKIFKDKNYAVTFEYFEPLNENNDEQLGTLKVIYQNKKVIFREKIIFYQPKIEFLDMNNDGIKDILILYQSSARSIWYQHLYLVDNKKNKIIYVKGFQNLPNPFFDSKNNIIICTRLADVTYYSFYRINRHNILIDLGNKFNSDDVNNSKYENAIMRILKNKK